MEFFHKVPRIPFMAIAQVVLRVFRRADRRFASCAGSPGLNFGIDFTGGVVLEVAFPQHGGPGQVRGTPLRRPASQRPRHSISAPRVMS